MLAVPSHSMMVLMTMRTSHRQGGHIALLDPRGMVPIDFRLVQVGRDCRWMQRHHKLLRATTDVDMEAFSVGEVGQAVHRHLVLMAVCLRH